VRLPGQCQNYSPPGMAPTPMRCERWAGHAGPHQSQAHRRAGAFIWQPGADRRTATDVPPMPRCAKCGARLMFGPDDSEHGYGWICEVRHAESESP
jgi:hypothetical protein